MYLLHTYCHNTRNQKKRITHNPRPRKWNFGFLFIPQFPYSPCTYTAFSQLDSYPLQCCTQYHGIIRVSPCCNRLHNEL